MPSDYNVDDILDEIRRKKSGESARIRESDTYQDGGYSPAPAPERERPRASGRRPVNPAPERTSERRAPVEYEQPAPRRAERPAKFPGGRTPGQPRTARKNEDAGFRFGEPAEQPRRTSRAPSYELDDETLPRRPARTPSYELDDETLPRRPARAPSYELEDETPPRRASRAPSYELEDETPPRRASRAPSYELEDEMPPRRASRAPSYEPEDEPKGFAFDAGTDADDFQMPLFDDEEEPPRRRAPVDNTRMDLPRTGRKPVVESDFTQEVDTPAPRAAKRPSGGEEGMVQTQWKQSMAAQELLSQQQSAEDDFSSPEDQPFVEKDLKAIRTGLNVRMALTGVLGAISLYLALALGKLPFSEALGLGEEFLLPLLPAIAPENNMRLFVIVNLVVCLLAAIVCANVVGSGLAALGRLRADNDTPAALAVIGVMIHGIYLIVSPDALVPTAEMVEKGQTALGFYFPAAVATLFFCLIGKKMLTGRIARNFKFLTSDVEKNAFLQIHSRDFSREFTRGLGADVDRVSYTAKTDFVTGFLDRSYSSDYSEQFARLVSPLVLVLALVVAVVSGVLSKDIAAAFAAFAALLCVTAPFSGTIIPQVMQASVAKKLTRQGGMITGYEAAEEFADTNAVIITDKDLFFAENVKLHGMKVFAEKRIDEAILDAASVILACDGIMSGVFLNMIGGNRRLLKKVDSLIYEDGMGLSAWVDGKRVLIGSQELMRGHGIDCPSRDFESRYVRDGRQVLYIANSGELSAMFVISYNPDPAVQETLLALERRGIALVVQTTDPNITAELLAMAFGVKRGKVRILPGKMQSEYQILSQPKEKVSADGCHAGGIKGILKLIANASAIRASVTRASVVQLIGIIVGYGLVSFMAFTGSLSSASFGALIVFNLAWMCLSWITAAASRK